MAKILKEGEFLYVEPNLPKTVEEETVGTGVAEGTGTLQEYGISVMTAEEQEIKRTKYKEMKKKNDIERKALIERQALIDKECGFEEGDHIETIIGKMLRYERIKKAEKKDTKQYKLWVKKVQHNEAEKKKAADGKNKTKEKIREPRYVSDKMTGIWKKRNIDINPPQQKSHAGILEEIEESFRQIRENLNRAKRELKDVEVQAVLACFRNTPFYTDELPELSQKATYTFDAGLAALLEKTNKQIIALPAAEFKKALFEQQWVKYAIDMEYIGAKLLHERLQELLESVPTIEGYMVVLEEIDQDLYISSARKTALLSIHIPIVMACVLEKFTKLPVASSLRELDQIIKSEISVLFSQMKYLQKEYPAFAADIRLARRAHKKNVFSYMYYSLLSIDTETFMARVLEKFTKLSAASPLKELDQIKNEISALFLQMKYLQKEYPVYEADIKQKKRVYKKSIIAYTRCAMIEILRAKQAPIFDVCSTINAFTFLSVESRANLNNECLMFVCEDEKRAPKKTPAGTSIVSTLTVCGAFGKNGSIRSVAADGQNKLVARAK